MASKTVVADLNRGEKLDGKNYDIWHRKIQYLLDESEVLETFTNSMEETEQGNSAQNRRDLEAYQSWRKKDRCARFTMLSSMHNDLIGKFESYGTAQDMWIALKAKFGGTTEQIKLNITHNESIQTLKDLSRHLELEVERRVAQGQSSAFFARHGQRQAFKAKHKSYEKAPQPGQNGGKPPKRANTAKRPRGKRGGRKQAEQACFNCGVVGHFAHIRATNHVARDRVGFVEYHRVPAGSRWMRIGNESIVEVLGIGTSKLQLRHGRTFLLHDVLYAPGMRQNLLSVNVLLELGFNFGFHGRSVDIFLGSTCFGHVFISNDRLFHLDIDCSAYDSSFALLTQNDYDEMNWHARLGHIGQDRMTRLAKEGLLGPFAKVNLPTCEHCLVGKSIRKPFGKGIRATVPLELIHSDVCGPMNVRARHGASYFITFIDDFTRYGYVYLVSHKSEVTSTMLSTNMENWALEQINVYLSDTLDESKGYVMLGEHLDGGVTEIVSRDVEFMKNDFPSRGDVDQNLELYEMVESWDDTLATNPGDSGREITPSGNDPQPQEDDSQNPQLRRSQCGNVPRQRFGIEGESFINAAQDDTEPRSYDKAMSSLACNEWIIAMKDEMKSMRTNQVWELVDLPLERKSIGNKWVLKIKRKADGSIDKYKVRLVAKGYTQREGVDYEETFSPVVRFASIRLILAMVASLDLKLHQMDVKIAFLNGELDEEIFMDQPIGFIVKGQECKEVISNGFLMIEKDHCVYVKRTWVRQALCLVSRSSETIQGNSLVLSRETYIRKVPERFHMQDCKPIDTPVGKGDSLSNEMCPKTQAEIESIARVPYANAIGNLMYAMLCTRPVIFFAVRLGRDLRLRGYSDADWAGDLDEHKSTSGYTFLLGGEAITCCSKKQSCVTLSTMESEYVACSTVVQEAVWLRRFFQRLDIVANAMDPVTIYSDSMAALAYAKDPKYYGKTKHIEIKYHYIRDMVAKKEVGSLIRATVFDAWEAGEDETCWTDMRSAFEKMRPCMIPSHDHAAWRSRDAFMTYASLRMEEKSTATYDHTTCARNDHQRGRQRLDNYFFGMLPIAMDYSALRDMTGRSVKPKLSGIRAKGRQSDNTSQFSACVRNSCRLWESRE
uniref:Integrase catalytic domain-containing protein n=1 Tax=Fagus sylvatica TaxID=28930 RepID=A0A2N9FKV1_FAGSY